MPQHVDPEDWRGLAGIRWDSIVVGNGASVNVWKRFEYDSLFSAARSDTASRPLTADEQALFAGLGTNFERVLSRLLTAEGVMRVLRDDDAADRVHARYRGIKDALAAAVHDVHLRWSESDQLQNVLRVIGEELRSYKSVFSTNYDVLVYWACMRAIQDAHRDVFKDGFFRNDANETVAFDITNASISGATQVWYPHGALHLVRTKDGETLKLCHREGASILDRFGETLIRDGVPLVITEGSSEEKVSSIRQTDYLSHALERLSGVRGNVVVFGHSLSGSDAHIVEALTRQAWDPRLIAVSIYPGGGDVAGEMGRIRQLLTRPNIAVRFFDSTTHPLGHPDLALG